MSYLPLRQYKLYIGFVKELDEKLKNKVAGVARSPVTIDMQSLPIDKRFIVMDQHQFTAKIHYPKDGSTSKNPQQQIEILNPHPDTIAMCRTANALLLEAGYTDDLSLPVICATQIVQCVVEPRRGTERVLRLICSDAHKVRRTIKFSKTYQSSFTYAQIIRDILAEFSSYGISSSYELDDIEDKQIGKARSFSGGLAEALTSICKSCDYKWYMCAGIIYVEPRVGKSELTHLKRIFTILPENLKESITEIQDTENKTESESKVFKAGIVVRINLNGNLNKGQAIKIGEGEYQGTYYIKDIKHNLNFEGTGVDSWDTILECYK